MTPIKERIQKWKSRKWHQKAGDIFFWVLLILLIIPGPRKFVATGTNKVFLHFRKPTLTNESKVYQMKDSDYQWDIRDQDGSFLIPESLRGEVLFLNFWGTYCPPCIAEMPEIQKLYNDYGKRVKFILVSAEAPEKVQSFLSSRGYDLPSYYGGRNMPEVFSVRSVPTTFIISGDGKIVTKKIGAADWDSRATRKIFDHLLENR
jgi:thiol-disulfide isomerase/thioredoxin